MKNKNLVIIIGLAIVALIFFTQGAKKEASGDVTNAVITRGLSATTVKGGTTFTATYTASGYGTGSWGVLIDDSVSGGCTPMSSNLGFLGPTQTSDSKTMTAPLIAGTCTFSGNYQFAGSTLKSTAGPSSVTVCMDACAVGSVGCVDTSTRWTCSATANPCYTRTTTSCQSYESCNAGVCVIQCTSLRTSALSAITSWAITPTSTTRTAALNAIMLWATNC